MTAPSAPPAERDRHRGALLGLAVGDAVGTTLEFRSPGSFTPITDLVGGGPFDLQPGQWTDDTSMALCLAESLVEAGGFDALDQLQRYVRWWREGHWSSTGTCFDIGNATAAALRRFEADLHDPYPGDADRQAGGNGVLMKLAPVPMAFAHDAAAAIDHAALSARTTHGEAAAIDTARYLAALLWGALNGVPRDVLVLGREDGEPYEPFPGAWSGERALHPAVAAVAGGSYLRREPPEIRGAGYAVTALEAALWAVARHDDYAAVVLAAANLGDDADTTAAIAGQLAGALHGVEGIPSRWRAVLHRHDEIVGLADALHALGTGER